MIFGSADENTQKFKNLVENFLVRQVDGIILAAPANSEETIQYIRDEGIPFVLIDRVFPRLKGVNSVMIDNFKASYEMVQHLSEKGFRYPAMITLTSELHHLHERSRGYNEAMRSLLSTNESNILEIEEEELTQRIESILLGILNSDKQIDSVIFSTNKIAIEALAVLATHRIKVPEQLGIICFDEADAYRIFNTGITYVKQPLQQIGEEAVRAVLSKIGGVEKIEDKVLNTQIIENDSTSKF